MVTPKPAVLLYDRDVVKHDGAVDSPARRSSDLPPDAPWWARWIEAHIHKAWTVLYGFSGVAVEVYATYPGEINEIVNAVVPASWWPHLIAVALIVNASRRAWKTRAR